MNCRRKNIQVSEKRQRLNALLSGKEVERIKRVSQRESVIFFGRSPAHSKGNIALSTTGSLSHAGEAMTEKRAFSLLREPKGDLYRALIDLGSQRCPTVLLVVRDPTMLAADGQKVLESLAIFLTDVQEATQWPGTVLYGDKAVVYRYHTSPELAELLKRLGTGLYSWQHPDLPEDLCLLRSDGTPWLASIAHEGDAYLKLTQDEMRELLDLEPRLAHCISAD